ncbi:hypothetical protein CP356_02590 [Lactobacillus sp. UMNPBX5]|nr:hypothetical protein CP356_02590 [Lactobacillus sp. UMNPBX5]
MPPHKNEETVTKSFQDIQNAIKYSIHKLIIDCKNYDAGDLYALYGDSSILRNLFYNSRQNKPLIQLVQAHKDIRMHSYAFFENHEVDYGSTIIARLPDTLNDNRYTTTYLFNPDLVTRIHKLPFTRWWEQPIFKFGNTIINRRILVKIDANQNGGSHFDTEIDSQYYCLLTGKTGIEMKVNFYNFQTIFGGDSSLIGKKLKPSNLPGALLREVIHETIISFCNYFDFIEEEYKPNFQSNLSRNRLNFTGKFDLVKDNK